MENYLYIVTRRLKRRPLNLKDMKDFQAWKLDLMEAWAAMSLPIADYQSTVNHLVMNRIDAHIQATVADLLPESKEEFATQKPEELLQQIEERLESTPGRTPKTTFQFSQARKDGGPGGIQRTTP